SIDCRSMRVKRVVTPRPCYQLKSKQLGLDSRSIEQNSASVNRRKSDSSRWTVVLGMDSGRARPLNETNLQVLSVGFDGSNFEWFIPVWMAQQNASGEKVSRDLRSDQNEIPHLLGITS